jgi:hypothetical protein
MSAASKTTGGWLKVQKEPARRRYQALHAPVHPIKIAKNIEAVIRQKPIRITSHLYDSVCLMSSF